MNDKTILSALKYAVSSCFNPDEEEGGIILVNKANEHEFIKLKNDNSGTDIALGLWTANRQEYADKIIPRFKEGWIHYASFHTHPIFYPTPSAIDATELFPGFEINFIYSQLHNKVTEWHTVNEDVISFAYIKTYPVEDGEIKII